MKSWELEKGSRVQVQQERLRSDYTERCKGLCLQNIPPIRCHLFIIMLPIY